MNIIFNKKNYINSSEINVREYGRGNQKWTIQINWQHRVNKKKKNKTKTHKKFI
jgi:hypothetical protein